MLFSTVASERRRPIQSRPEAGARDETAEMRGIASPSPSPSRRDRAAGRLGDRREPLGGGDHVLEFGRIGRADMGERGQRRRPRRGAGRAAHPRSRRARGPARPRSASSGSASPVGPVTVTCGARLRKRLPLDDEVAALRNARSAPPPPAPARASASGAGGGAAPRAGRRRHSRAPTARHGRRGAWRRGPRPRAPARGAAGRPGRSW